MIRKISVLMVWEVYGFISGVFCMSHIRDYRLGVLIAAGAVLGLFTPRLLED